MQPRFVLGADVLSPLYITGALLIKGEALFIFSTSKVFVELFGLLVARLNPGWHSLKGL